MPDYQALSDKKTHLIRKALDGSVFLGDYTTAAIEFITGADSQLIALPVGMADLGYLSTDGAQFSRDVSSSDVNSWGAQESTRTDIVSDSTQLTVLCQETKKGTMGLGTGADLSALVPEPGGEVAFSKPARPKTRTYRVLSLAVDDSDAGEIYIGRFLPRATPSSFSEQTFGAGDDPISWGVTFQGKVDSDLGYSERYCFGGPGWAAILEDMGFPPAGV